MLPKLVMLPMLNCTEEVSAMKHGSGSSSDRPSKGQLSKSVESRVFECLRRSCVSLPDDVMQTVVRTLREEFALELELVECVEQLARRCGEQEVRILDQPFVLEVRRIADHRSAVMKPETDDDEGMDEDVLRLERKLLRQGLREQRARLKLPDMLTLQQATDLSGIPIRTLTHMRISGRLLALAAAGAQRGFRYPAWQFDSVILEAMANIVAAFGRNRTWQAFDFLTRPEPLLRGEVPLDLLRAGRKGEVERILGAVVSLEQGAY